MPSLSSTLIEKLNVYKQVLENTTRFRQAWPQIKQVLTTELEHFLQTTGIRGKVINNTVIENLESITMDFGRSSSGIAPNQDNTDIRNFMIKVNGVLIYQQLFNGKIMVMVQQPYIEGQVEPKEPQFIEIVTPEELNTNTISLHLETFLQIITEWEDFDDEGPQKKTAFQPIGFQHGINTGTDDKN